MFYAPTCPHCKELMPEWEQLAQHYKGTDDLVIAKIDDTQNEVTEVDIEGYPQVMFFGEGKNAESKMFDKEMRLKNFKSFLNKNVKSLKKEEAKKAKELKAKKPKKEEKAQKEDKPKTKKSKKEKVKKEEL
jgi:protein disulfide-isomerase A1